jgi:imidazole glycerol-phosphate synthase subunit HisH
MIGIIDYGMGNLFSVSKALERLGIPYIICESPEE